MGRAIAVCLTLLPLTLAAAEVSERRDPQSGLLSWLFREGAVSVELVQLLPDFIRAAYTARRLPTEVVEGVASQCVFGTIVRNESQGPVAYRVADWRYVTPDGREYAIKTKSEWVSEWRDLGIAFQWSILPDDQVLEVGDWSQGFTTVALPPGSTFDLRVVWSVEGQEHHGTIEGMRCVTPEPTR